MGWTFSQRLRRMRSICATGAVLPVAVALGWATPLAAGAAPAHANRPPNPQTQEQIDLTASSVEADNPNKTADFTQIVVTQGTMRIEAERAHAMGFTGMEENNVQDGRWTFTGNVHIYAEPHGTLQSDQAVVEMRNRRMTTATATGNPAEFQQRHPTTGELTHGHAELIVYDIDAGTVRLTNNAFITTGRQTVTGPLVVYNIRQQRVLADSGKAGKANVHVTIVPQSNPMNTPPGATPGAGTPGTSPAPAGAAPGAAAAPATGAPATPAPPKKPQQP